MACGTCTQKSKNEMEKLGTMPVQELSVPSFSKMKPYRLLDSSFLQRYGLKHGRWGDSLALTETCLKYDEKDIKEIEAYIQELNASNKNLNIDNTKLFKQLRDVMYAIGIVGLYDPKEKKKVERKIDKESRQLALGKIGFPNQYKVDGGQINGKEIRTYGNSVEEHILSYKKEYGKMMASQKYNENKDERLKSKIDSFLSEKKLSREQLHMNNDELIKWVDKMMRTEKEQEFLKMTGKEIEIDDNICECEKWTVGNIRCSCGNRRMGYSIQGDIAGGFYSVVEAY